MNYWQNRSFEITKEIFADSESYVKFIHNEYEKAIAELDGRILNHLNAMSSEQGVSLAEANKLLSQAERMDLQEFINKAKGKITPDIEKSLNLASRRVRISRLQAMELEIKTSVSKLLNTEEKRLFAHLTNTFNKRYYNELYGLQRITGYENIFKINDDELRQIILNPWAVDGSDFSNRIWKRRDKLVGTLRADLTRNIIAGRSNDNIIKNISSAMNVSKANAGRLVMTESAAMNSIATEKAYNRMKTEKYEILATLDLKTSDICQDMDSKIFDVKDYSVGITAPPFHPNCRTTTIPYFDDDLGLEDTRVARNIDTGKSEKVPDMSYKTWYDKYVVDKNVDTGYNDNINPESLQYFYRHGDRWKKKVVMRYLDDDEIKLVGDRLKNIIDDNEYALRIESEYLKNVLEDGRFKNQFETNTSGGVVSEEFRIEATHRLFGADIENLKSIEYEKYGYLGFKDFIKDLHVVDVEQYGDCIVHFDKIKLKNNVTYTVDDSLDLALDNLAIAGNASNPSANGISKEKLNFIYSLLYFDDDMDLETFIKEMDISYIELQYHGVLRADFIKEICFIDDLPSDDVIKKLNDKNIKVYKIIGENKNEKLVRIR